MVNLDRVIGLICGVLLSAVLLSCVSAGFPYKYYPYDATAHKLVGAEPVDDLDDAVCLPRTGNVRPCTVVLTDDFFNLKADYLKTKDQLIRCERGGD